MPGKLTLGCMKVHVGVLILLCSTLRSRVHNLFSHFRTVSRDWEATMRQNVVLPVFHTQNMCHNAWKTLRTTH